MAYTKVYVRDPLTSVEAVIYQAVMEGRVCSECDAPLRDSADWEFRMSAFGETRWTCMECSERERTDASIEEAWTMALGV